MISIDKVCYHSKLRYENSEQKLLYGVITLLITVGCRSLCVACIVFFLNMYLLIFKSGLSCRKFIHYMTIPLSFILLSTISIILNISSQPLDAFAIAIPFLIGEKIVYITCSVESLHFAIKLICIAIASVTNLYFISFTTPMPDILRALQEIRVPTLCIEIMLLIYRYIFVLLEMADNIHKAQQVRLGNRNYKTSIKSFGQLISVVFIRAMKKSNILYDAMESRCYDGRMKVLSETYAPRKKITIAIILYELILIGIAILEMKGGLI